VIDSLQRRRTVHIRLDATSATVHGRRGRRVVVEHHGDADATSPAHMLRQVLRASDLLRPGRPCDLRIAWEPTQLLLRIERRALGHNDRTDVSSAPGGPEAVPALQQELERLDPDATVALVDLRPTTDACLSVMVRTVDVDGIAAALRMSRVEGRARLDVAVLVRTRAVLQRVSTHIEGRRGFVVDVTASNVIVLALDRSTVEAVRAAARRDAPSQVSRMFADLVADLTPLQPRPWLSIHAGRDDADDLRAACRAALPGRTAIDLLRSSVTEGTMRPADAAVGDLR
jgi:hypothetical protein